MRKIEQQIGKAFNSGKKLSVGNTETDGKSVFLHGNEIIKRMKGHVYISLAGWPTPTTRSRINAITGAHTNQSRDEQYLDGKPIDCHAWYKVKGS